MRDPVTVACVQAEPAILDRDATLAKLERLTGEAAAPGAQLVVFPRRSYRHTPRPSGRRSSPAGRRPRPSRPSRGSHASRVEIPGPDVDRIGAAAKEHGVWLVVGVNEVDAERPGATLYNSLLTFSPAGELALHHRKLVPTNHERLVWGQGDGRGLRAIPTPLGRIGGLICWENYMPLARFALYESGVEIYLASTADDGDAWQATLVHIARESRAVRRRAEPLPARELLPGRLPARRRARGPRDRRPRRQRDPRRPTARTSPARSTTRRGSCTPSSTRRGCSRSASASTPPATTTGRTCSGSRSPPLSKSRQHALTLELRTTGRCGTEEPRMPQETAHGSPQANQRARPRLVLRARPRPLRMGPRVPRRAPSRFREALDAFESRGRRDRRRVLVPQGRLGSRADAPSRRARAGSRGAARASATTTGSTALSDWVTVGTLELPDLLHDCDILAIKAANGLEGVPRAVVMQWLLAVEAHVLGFIERHRETPPSRARARDLRRAPAGELRRIESYYQSAGEKRARLRYVEGMLGIGS